MPHLPFSGADPDSLRQSRNGAASAADRANHQIARLVELYRRRGRLTDHEAAKLLGVPNTSICARRRELRARGLIKTKGRKLGPWGLMNTCYGLTDND